MSAVPCPFRFVQGLLAPLPWPDPEQFGSYLAYWWATLARASYETDGTLPARALADKAATTGFQFRPNTDADLVPGFYWALQGGTFVVVVSGTSNDGQWLFELLTHAFDFSAELPGYEANAAFALAGNTVANAVRGDFVAAGSPPLLVIGHSYGAAAAAIAYSLLRPGVPLNSDRVVSLGAPRFANARMNQLLDAVQVTRLVTPGDPVAWIPPPQTILVAASLAFPGASLGAREYLHLGDGLQIDGSLGLQPIGEGNPSAAEWLRWTLGFVLRGAVPEPHFARAYVAALFDFQRASPPRSGPTFVNYPDLFEVNRLLTEGGL